MDHKGHNKRNGSAVDRRNREYPEVNSAEISSSSSSSPSSSIDRKSCEICRTTKTPLWRGGPSGPKSLCNACGIKYRKKRREFLGLNNTAAGAEKDSSSSNSSKKENKSVMRLLGFATDLFLQQRSILKLKRRRRLAEEEEAAVLLMALSSGFLYA